MTKDLRVSVAEGTESGTKARISRRRLLACIPLAGAAGLVGALALGLGRDPGELPSVLIGKPVPDFHLPPVQGRTLGLSTVDLRGEVSLVNVFASWCVPCRLEHPLMMQLTKANVVPLFGINYKDAPADAAKWLDGKGDPYRRTGADRDGRVAIDFGVYGVPETFVIDRGGLIAHRHVGALTTAALSDTILPLVARLKAAAGEAHS